MASLDSFVRLIRKNGALKDDFVLLCYCSMHPLHKRIRNAYLGTISGQKFFDTLNIENFLMVNVSACGPLDLNDRQKTSYKQYTNTASGQCGILNGLEVTKVVKKLYCIPYIYGLDYVSKYALIEPALKRTSSRKHDIS